MRSDSTASARSDSAARPDMRSNMSAVSTTAATVTAARSVWRVPIGYQRGRMAPITTTISLSISDIYCKDGYNSANSEQV